MNNKMLKCKSANYIKENYFLYWDERANDHDLKQINEVPADYMFKVYMLSYIKKSILYSALEYKKKNQIQRLREELILNSTPEGHDEELLNTIQSTEKGIEELIDDYRNKFQPFENIVEDERILWAINCLTKYQREIIYMIYISEIREIDIAKKLNVSLQSVNKTKNTSIRKLRKHLGVK